MISNLKKVPYILNGLKISVFDTDERAIDAQIKIDKASKQYVI